MRIDQDATVTRKSTLPICPMRFHSYTPLWHCCPPLSSLAKPKQVDKSDDSPLLPAQPPCCSPRGGQDGLLREPRETGAHCSGIWEQLWWSLPPREISDLKGRAGKVGGVVWHFALCSSTALKERWKAASSSQPPPQATLPFVNAC